MRTSTLFVDSCSEASVVAQVRVSPTLPETGQRGRDQSRNAPLPLLEMSVPGAEEIQLPRALWHCEMVVEGTGSVRIE